MKLKSKKYRTKPTNIIDTDTKSDKNLSNEKLRCEVLLYICLCSV